MSMKKFIALLMFSSLLASCGSPEDFIQDPRGNDKTIYKTQPAEAEAFTYELRSKSCSTGKHSFGSFENACKALIDEELNNECAIEKREELFLNSDCPGNFT